MIRHFWILFVVPLVAVVAWLLPWQWVVGMILCGLLILARNME